MKKKTAANIALFLIMIHLTSCSSFSLSNIDFSSSEPSISTTHSSLWQGNHVTIWQRLQHQSTQKLNAMQHITHSPEQVAWLQLALISKHNSIETKQFMQALLAWRKHYPTHPANALFPDDTTLNQLLTTSAPQRITILVPLHGPYAAAGQALRDGFLNAYYTHLPTIGKQEISFYDTTQNQNIRTLYQKAIKEETNIVIGPLVKNDVQQLLHLGSFPVVTLALNYTHLSFGTLPKNFYEFGLLPEDEVQQVANRAREAGHVHAIVIAPENTWGKRLVTALTHHWTMNGGTIQKTWYYNQSDSFPQEIARLLHVNTTADHLLNKDSSKQILNQQRDDFDVIFLFAPPQDARAITPILRYYSTGHLSIYATSAVYGGKPNPVKDVDLNGIIICDIPRHIPLAQYTPSTNSETPFDRLYAVGQDAYLLSQTLPRLTLIPHFPIHGATGALTLSSQHQIHRRLPCFVVRNGLLSPIAVHH